MIKVEKSANFLDTLNQKLMEDNAIMTMKECQILKTVSQTELSGSSEDYKLKLGIMKNERRVC